MKRTRKKPSPRKPSSARGRLRWIFPLTTILILCLTLAATVYVVFLRQSEVRTGGEKTAHPKTLEPRQHKQLSADNVPTAAALPVVAIVIDDMGQAQTLDQQFIALDLDLSFAFLPDGRHTRSLSRDAARRGRDVLLHLPMEPLGGGHNPGPMALMTGMPPEKLRALFLAGLAAVPDASGVNNHMGSLFTSDPRAMAVVLEMARDRGLFFLDSVTSADSKAYAMARRLGIRTGQRQVFLDNEPDAGKIRIQLQELVARAEKEGEAIAIGHPRPATLEALASFRPELLARTRVAGVHHLMR